MAKLARIESRVDEEFKAQIEALAIKENRTVSGYIENILKNEIKRAAMTREDEVERRKEKYFEMTSKQIILMATDDEIRYFLDQIHDESGNLEYQTYPEEKSETRKKIEKYVEIIKKNLR